MFNRTFAMIIYGIILFPSAMNVVILEALSVFHAVEYHHINPLTAILTETYMTLNFCHTKK